MNAGGTTKEERKSRSVAKHLVKALAELERFNGDPLTVLQDAMVLLSEEPKGVSGAVEALVNHYEDTTSEERLERLQKIVSAIRSYADIPAKGWEICYPSLMKPAGGDRKRFPSNEELDRELALRTAEFLLQDKG